MMTTLRQVTNRVHSSSKIQTGFTSAMCRCWQFSFVPVRFIQIGLDTFATDSASSGAEIGSGTPTTFAASLEYPAGVFTQLTWSGATTAAVASGTTGWTDLVDLGFTIPAFAKFWLRIYEANATMMISHSWSQAGDPPNGDAYVFNGSNQTMSGTIVSNGPTYMRFPSAVLSYSTLPVMGFFGDSRTQGVNDAYQDITGGAGFFGRATSKFIPSMNFGCGGDQMQWFATKSANRRAVATAGGVTFGVNAYGINDFTGGIRTAAQVAADRETIRGLFSFPMLDTTVPPQTVSTDGFKTAANQTVTGSGSNAERVAYNDALRAAPAAATSPGLFDIAALVETSVTNEIGPEIDGSVWMPRFMNQGDGTHPTWFGYDAISIEFEKVVLTRAA